MQRIRLAGIIPMDGGYALMHRKDVKKYPNRVIVGTETFCADAYGFWEDAK